MKKITALVLTLAGGVALTSTEAAAQADYTSMDRDTLRGEVQQRYDAALAITVDPSIVSADDPRYIWASEAKVQCGIALGYLKSNTRDETSLSKCYSASDRMTQVPREAVVQAPEAPAAVCNREAPGLIFFDFDSAVPGSDAVQIVEYVTANAEPCGWSSFNVVGHADRAGSNSYNMGLSQRRAEAVAELMASRGINRAAISTEAMGEESPRVPTEDGVRELQNRRVEIQVTN